MLAARELPREEWARLDATYLAPLRPYLPDTARVLVVERDGAIVAGWSLSQLWHAEGIFTTDPHAFGLLLKAMRALADSLGVSGVITGSETDAVHDMLLRRGATELPGRHYLLPVEGLPCL